LFAHQLHGFSADWERFRGFEGAGVSQAHDLPEEFGPKTNLIWRTAAPAGCSSPVVAGNRVWLAGYENNRRLVWCLDLSNGRHLWEREIDATGSERKSKPNDAASSTPVTDGVNVYALFSGFGLVSYGSNGEERWRVPLGPFTQPHGMASSPILAGNQIIVLADQIQDSYVAAFDTATGKLKWRTARPNFVGGYSTPLLWHDKVVVAGPVELVAYAADSGVRLWSVPKMGVMPIGSPACGADRIFVNNGAVPPFEALAKMKGDRNGDGKLTPEEFPDPSFKEAVLAIDRVYGNGDGAVDKAEWNGALKLMETLNTLVAVQWTGSNPKEVWRSTKLFADVASPLVYQNVLYLLKDGGLLTGLDPDNGDVLWRERVAETGSRYFASPVAADGKVFIVGENGQASVVKAGRVFSRLSLNDLGEECYATPAIGGEFLLIRTLHTLWAFGIRTD
jgi:outer membrane protein assembly factor BamB